MTLNQIKYFYEAAKLEHLNQAAEVLGISEPSLSRAINQLEKEIDLPLFEKKGRGICLTKPGSVFYEYAEKILSNVTLLEQKMEELNSTHGHINVAYVAPLATKLIPTIVKNYFEEPDAKATTFNFYQGLTADNIKKLRNGEYDLIFGSRDENATDIQFVPIDEQELVVIAPKNHPLSIRKEVTPVVFEEYPVLSYDNGSGLGMRTRAFFRNNGVTPNFICESPDEIGIASFVAEGFGIALVADVPAVHQDSIAIIPLAKEYRETHTIYMGYVKNSYLLPSVSQLISYVTSNKDKWHV